MTCNVLYEYDTSCLFNFQYFAPDGKTAIVEITAQTEEQLQAAKEEIIKYAKYVTAKREKHQQRVRTEKPQ